jgi:hypothetical protein
VDSIRPHPALKTNIQSRFLSNTAFPANDATEILRLTPKAPAQS